MSKLDFFNWSQKYDFALITSSLSSEEVNSAGHTQRAPVQRIQQYLRAKDEVQQQFKVIQVNQKVIFETSSSKPDELIVRNR
jgi:hypothetical protein